MDRRLYLDVNRLARQTAWLHGFARAYALWLGLALLAAVLLLVYWRARSGSTGGGPRQVAATVWAGAGAAVAFGLSQPLAHLVGRARPYSVLPGVEVLVHRVTGPGLPSAYGAAGGAVAVGCLLARDRAGVLLAAVVALVLAAARVYVGAGYPGDLLAGIGFGALVALAGYPLVVPLLERVVAAFARTPLGVLVAPGSTRSRLHHRELARERLAAEVQPARAGEGGPAARPPVLAATGAVRLLDGPSPVPRALPEEPAGPALERDHVPSGQRRAF